MNTCKFALAATIAVATAAVTIPQDVAAQRGWTTIGSREVNGGLDRDVIPVRGSDRYSAIRICAKRRPVRLIDADVDFANGGRQDMQAASLLSAGECTPALKLNGNRRNIEAVRLSYAKFRLFSRPPLLTVQAR